MIELKCKVCGKSFLTYPAYKNKRKTCSKKCFYKKLSKKWKGENNPRWKFGRSKCEICGNVGHGGIRSFGKMLCRKHYLQMYKKGKIERTRFDKHEFVCNEKYCKINIYNRKQDVICKVKVDKEDLERVIEHKWSLDSNGYLFTNINKKRLALHQFILGKKEGYDIDHINSDRIDNRKENLRYATRSQNLMNKRNVLGITWDKNRKKWLAQITVNKKHINLGRYDNKEEALKVRRDAEKKHFKEFAPKR
jgi:hypothetical protein